MRVTHKRPVADDLEYNRIKLKNKKKLTGSWTKFPRKDMTALQLKKKKRCSG